MPPRYNKGHDPVIVAFFRLYAFSADWAVAWRRTDCPNWFSVSALRGFAPLPNPTHESRAKQLGHLFRQCRGPLNYLKTFPNAVALALPSVIALERG